MNSAIVKALSEKRKHRLRPATYILETIYVERTALFYEVKEKSQGSPG